MLISFPPPLTLSRQSKWRSSALLCLLFISISTLSGCATLNKGDCLKGDWAAIGYNDAAAGLRGQSELRDHYAACAEYKVRPNEQVYFSGYQRGLTRFCTREAGFKHGAASSEYYGICPQSLEPQFLDGYLTGLDLAIGNAWDDLDELRDERSEKARKLTALRQSGRNDKQHRKAVKKLKQRIESLQSDISSKRSDQSQLRTWHAVWAR